MAKAAPKKEAAATEEKGQGRAVILPNVQKRVDYIRDRYYNDGVKRGDIRREINEMLAEAGREDEQIPYQIVFASTKKGEPGDKSADPRNAPKAEAKEADKK